MLRLKNMDILLLLLLFFIPVNAAIDWYGYLQTDNRLLIKDWSWSWQEYRLSLQNDYKHNDNIHFFSEIWVRSLGFSKINNSNDWHDREKITPVDIDLREAYINIYGFINKHLDLRIGRQRIAWGVADKLNPTDNLNPNDFEDIWDFGRHLASNSIQVTYYLKDLSINGVFIPNFTPAVLPRKNRQLLLINPQLPAMNYQNLSATIILPTNKLRECAIYGTKLSKTILGYDFSLSYVYGRYDLPILQKMTFTLADTLGTVNLLNEYVYPRTQILGFDIAGAIKEVGIWTEGAMYWPEKIFLKTDMTALGFGCFDTLILDNRPYFRCVVGLDYTFSNGIYINLQYLHGFVTERGKNNLHDYIMLGIDWKMFQDKLKINPFNGGVEIKKWPDFKNNYAIVIAPEINYKPFDNTELTLGVRYIHGDVSTTFGQLKDDDELFLKVKYNF